jgi:flagellar protein FliS
MPVTHTGIVEHYKRTEIETATPAKLLLLLYDAAIQRLETAAEAMRTGKFERAHIDLLRVQDILTELMVSLDWGAKGAPVKELYSLYEYMYRGLVNANIKREVPAIEEAGKIMSELRDAWQEAVRQIGGRDGGASLQSHQRRLDIAG